jgi:DNA polymerase-3 subunit chi
MTRVEFFFNVEDKLKKLVELSEKAVEKNVRVMILMHDETTALGAQQYFWQQSVAFLPNCGVTDTLAKQTPIIIDCQADVSVHDDVLISLQHPQPTIFSRFKRLIEIVGMDEADKVLARTRYKFYRDRGYEIRSYDALGRALQDLFG